jgi:hypothetical protein
VIGARVVSSLSPADHAKNEGTESADLTELLLRAQTGLRSQVAPLVDALDAVRFLVPLQKPIAEAALGVELELDGELSLSPHLLGDSDDLGYVVAFSRPDLVGPVAEQMGWRTAGEELQVCALPGRVTFEMALELVDGREIVGMLIDPGADSELMLQRHEIASMAQGRPLPLVGYVAQIPPTSEEKTLVAELAEPPPEAMVRTIEGVLAGRRSAARWALRRTFNAERDLEPHWTLTFQAAEVDDALLALADDVAGALEGKVPPPGYIDILFDEDTAP